ncbi:MAG: glycosyltransferase family 39 protein [Candidatus Rokubacteria bacterium]|nr:glycosyltransferase family 39 protein [Candidatus Rokubacteria bacterium]
MTTPRQLAVLLGLAAVLLFAGLGATALTDRDEGANADAAREMLEQRSWVTPTLNYGPRFVKPPFVYWLMAAAYATLGVTETAARLPSALAIAALVLLQYAFARWALGATAAFRAGLILLLSVEIVALGRMALTDATLTLWTTAAGFAFFRAYHGDAPGRRWYAAMYATMALATLTKGPVGVLVPALGITAYLTLAGGWPRFWREARLGWGLALFLLLVGPWYGKMLWLYGEEYLARARGETLGRVLRAVTGPGGTVLFYVPVVLVGFFPWSALLPSALVSALRDARTRAASGRAGAASVFAAAWVVVGLGFFSLFRSRLPHYVAPLFPAAALLLAATWPERVPRLARGLLGGLGLSCGGALIAAWVLGPTLTRLLASTYPTDPGAALPRSVVAIGALVLAAGAAAGFRDGSRLLPALAVLTAALLALGLHAVLPAFSADFVAPPGELVRRALPAVGPCDTLVAFGPYRPSLLLAARRPITFIGVQEPSRLVGIAARPGRLFLLTPRGLLDRLPPALAALPRLDSRGGYLLLASPPTDEHCQ